MRQIRTEPAGCHRAADGVAIYACGCLEDASACDLLRILIRSPLLVSDPGFKNFGGVYRDAEEHLRVLRAAILRALAEIDARLVRVYPHFIYAIRNQVCLSGKLRNPETVISVGGKQYPECRCGMNRIAHRDVQFVGRHDAERRISEFPPELVADRGYLHGCRGFRSILDGMNDAGGSQKHIFYDQNRNDGPGQFNLCTPVYLSRLALSTRRFVAEFHDRISQ